MFLAAFKKRSAVLLSMAFLGLAGCSLFQTLIGGGGFPGAGPTGLTIGGTVQLHLVNESGLPVVVDADYTIGTHQVRFTKRFLTADGKDAEADVLATVTEKLIVTATVSVPNPENSAAQPGDVLLHRDLTWKVDFKDGERLVLVIPPPPAPAPAIIDCNGNGIADATDIANGAARDCNCNTIPDSCDLASGVLTDSNGDNIADQCLRCPPLDVVFIFDTSGSMADEAAAICNNAEGVINLLQSQGITVSATMLGIFSGGDTLNIGGEEDLHEGVNRTSTTESAGFDCLEDFVDNLFGTQVPGGPGSCNANFGNEDWGPAVAIVAQSFPWRPGALRVIVPVSDEGPCNGNPCDQFGADGEIASIAGNIALANQAVVSPILGDGANACVTSLAQTIATQTGGQIFSSTAPGANLAIAIQTLITSVCTESNQCN